MRQDKDRKTVQGAAWKNPFFLQELYPHSER